MGSLTGTVSQGSADDETWVVGLRDDKWTAATLFPPTLSALLSCHHGPAAGRGLPGRLDARPVPALPADHGPALHLSQGLPQTSTGEPEPLTATEHDGEGRVRLQGDDHQEGELRVQSTGVAASGDDEVAIGHLLLHPWPSLSAHVHLEVQGDHRRGSEETFSTRVSQCISTGRSA